MAGNLRLIAAAADQPTMPPPTMTIVEIG